MFCWQTKVLFILVERTVRCICLSFPSLHLSNLPLALFPSLYLSLGICLERKFRGSLLFLALSPPAAFSHPPPFFYPPSHVNSLHLFFSRFLRPLLTSTTYFSFPLGVLGFPIPLFPLIFILYFFFSLISFHTLLFPSHPCLYILFPKSNMFQDIWFWLWWT